MGDINLPLLRQTPEALSTNTDFIEDDDLLNIPFTMGDCITYRYLTTHKRFNVLENIGPSLEIIHGKISESEFLFDVERINHIDSLNPPSFFKKFWMSFVFMLIVLTISIFLILIWAILILDLVFLALGLYILRKVVVITWVWKIQLIEKSYFSHLSKILVELNVKYDKVGLEWTLGTYKHWLQLGAKKTKHNVLG